MSKALAGADDQGTEHWYPDNQSHDQSLSPDDNAEEKEISPGPSTDDDYTMEGIMANKALLAQRFYNNYTANKADLPPYFEVDRAGGQAECSVKLTCPNLWKDTTGAEHDIEGKVFEASGRDLRAVKNSLAREALGYLEQQDAFDEISDRSLRGIQLRSNGPVQSLRHFFLKAYAPRYEDAPADQAPEGEIKVHCRFHFYNAKGGVLVPVETYGLSNSRVEAGQFAAREALAVLAAL